MKARVITAMIGVPIVLACLFSTNPWPLAILASLAGFFSLRELWHMLSFKQSSASILLTAVCVLAPMIVATVATKRDALDLPAFTVPWLVGIGALTWLHSGRYKLVQAALGIGYIVGPLVALIAIHTLSWPQTNTWNFATPTLVAVLPIWAGDTAAILAGKVFGKTPFVPSISPNKTLEGAAAYLIAAVVAGWGIGYALGFPDVKSLLCGTLCGTLGQVGDLFESWLKRRAGQKDSGDLLPGHGGILDRIDSLLMTMAPIYGVLLLHR